MRRPVQVTSYSQSTGAAGLYIACAPALTCSSPLSKVSRCSRAAARRSAAMKRDASPARPPLARGRTGKGRWPVEFAMDARGGGCASKLQQHQPSALSAMDPGPDVVRHLKSPGAAAWHHSPGSPTSLQASACGHSLHLPRAPITCCPCPCGSPPTPAQHRCPGRRRRRSGPAAPPT